MLSVCPRHVLSAVLDWAIGEDYDIRMAVSKDVRIVTVLPAVMGGEEHVHGCQLRPEVRSSEQELPAGFGKITREDELGAAYIHEADEAEVVGVGEVGGVCVEVCRENYARSGWRVVQR